MKVDSLGGRWVPRPAVVSPFVATWLLNRLGPNAVREGVQWAESLGRADLAADLGRAFDQLSAAAADWRARLDAAASVNGSAEVGSAEAGAGLDSPLMPGGWTTRQVAERLAVTPRQVCNLIRAEKLSATRVGRSWLIDPVSVEAYVEQLARSAA